MGALDAYYAQAELLQALAHPMRLRILDILATQGECCVCHITAILRQRQPYVSQHLMVLREQGLVSDRKDGVMVHYSITDQRVARVLALTRALLSQAGTPSDCAPIPSMPVVGCTCPKCTGRDAS